MADDRTIAAESAHHHRRIYRKIQRRRRGPIGPALAAASKSLHLAVQFRVQGSVEGRAHIPFFNKKRNQRVRQISYTAKNFRQLFEWHLHANVYACF